MLRSIKRLLKRDASGDLLWHVGFIRDLAKVMRPALYVELGVHRAQLFNQVIPYAGQLIGVDIDPTTVRYVRRSPNARFVCGTTDSLAEELRGTDLKIDMLFIDADHCKESVAADFHHYLPLVRQQGLILIHDSHPGDASLLHRDWCGDSYLAVEELQRTAAGYEMMTIPRSPGLTLCRKRTTQLSWMEPADRG